MSEKNNNPGEIAGAAFIAERSRLKESEANYEAMKSEIKNLFLAYHNRRKSRVKTNIITWPIAQEILGVKTKIQAQHLIHRAFGVDSLHEVLSALGLPYKKTYGDNED